MACLICNWIRLPKTRAQQYKLGVEILSCLVILAQLIRIAVIGYEIKNITNEFNRKIFSTEEDVCDHKSIYVFFPKSTPILFGLMSIFLATLCSFILEPLLLWSVKKRHLPGIQPWFMTTLLIFLVAILSCVITSSIFVIKPIDHNLNSRPFYPRSNATIVDFCLSEGHLPPPPANISNKAQIFDRSFQISDSTKMSLKVAQVKGFISCIRLSSTSSKSYNSTTSVRDNTGTNETEIQEDRKEEWILTGLQRVHDLSPCLDQPELRKPVYYELSPVLGMSFLIDIVRCLPQLFLVNRFVKAEKLHVVHMTSHSSLTALYIKHPLTV